MRIEILESGREANVYRFFGFICTNFVQISPGRWVRPDGSWASRELAIRLEEVVSRTLVLMKERAMTLEVASKELGP